MPGERFRQTARDSSKFYSTSRTLAKSEHFSRYITPFPLSDFKYRFKFSEYVIDLTESLFEMINKINNIHCMNSIVLSPFW